MRRLLCVLTINPDFLQFAIPQLKSLLHNAPYPLETLLHEELKNKYYAHRYEINHKQFEYFPFVTLNVPNYDQHKQYFQNFAREAVMVLKVVLLLSSGSNYEELFMNGDQQYLQTYCRNDNQLVSCQFYSHNRVLPREDQIANIHKVLANFDIRGKVNFKQPNIKYVVIQQHNWYQQHHKDTYETTLKKVYFGIELSSNKIATAKFNHKFQLNKRIYLGPTSTDNDLAFMMCNQALIDSSSCVIDPFVGTGGLLIPPATKGAITFGSDLDIRVINGYSVGRINKKSPFFKQQQKYELFTPKINLNFKQYELNIPNIIRIDSTRLIFREGQFFDAIITDPPYGIRAMSRSVTKKQEPLEQEEQKKESKQEVSLSSESQQQLIEAVTEEIGNLSVSKQRKQMTEQERQKRKQKRKILRENKKKRKQLLPEEQKEFKRKLMQKLNKQRVGQWQKYDKGKIQTAERQKIFAGLLDFAKRYLKKQGRLVFLYPIYEEQIYEGVANLPSHEGFKVIDLSQNKMSKGNSRILVTLQKI